MGMLDDMIAADAAIFTDSDFSAEVETITYTPHGASPVTLSVQVFREPPRNLGRGQVAGRFLRIFLRRHATLGRMTVDCPGDRVTIAFKKGGTPETKPVAKIESEDAGGFMLVME